MKILLAKYIDGVASSCIWGVNCGNSTVDSCVWGVIANFDKIYVRALNKILIFCNNFRN